MKKPDFWSRRGFIKASAGAVSAAWLHDTMAEEHVTAEAAFSEIHTAEDSLCAASKRKLGKTGLVTSLLGMGTGVRSWGGESALTRKGRGAYMDMLRHACESGITYFDMADQYGSHDYVREALKTFMDRDRVTLQTKAWTREPEQLKEDIERFRQELDTDVLDIVLYHCITHRDGEDWSETLQPGMDVMAEAKSKGQIRAVGVSCHSFKALEIAATCPWVDVIMARINPFQVNMDGPPDEVAAVLKTASDNGKAVIGMKIVGEGQLADRIPESLQFVLGLGYVDLITVGFLETRELDEVAADIASLHIPVRMCDTVI